jgi:hypothetical protein
MGSENIHLCRICHSEFETEEDLSLHACVKIKQEFQEINVLDNYDVGQNSALAQDLKNYELPSNVKFNMDDEKPRKLCICGICNKSFKDNYRLRRHISQVHTKDWNLNQPDHVFEPKTKIETQDAQDFKVEEQFDFEYTDVELSEEFLSKVLRLVDEVCDVINKGDSNFERTVKVVQNLKDDVSCYRNKLALIDSKIEAFTETKKEGHFLQDLLSDPLDTVSFD